MTDYQLISFVKGFQIIKNCDFERVKYLHHNIIKKIYLVSWHRKTIVENLLKYNFIFGKNVEFEFHLHESILLNVNDTINEPRFIFQNYENKLIVTTNYFLKLPKYKIQNLKQKFKYNQNIRLVIYDEKIYFCINKILDIKNNKDLNFLLELSQKKEEIINIINEPKQIIRVKS